MGDNERRLVWSFLGETALESVDRSRVCRVYREGGIESIDPSLLTCLEFFR